MDIPAGVFPDILAAIAKLVGIAGNVGLMWEDDILILKPYQLS